MLENPFRSAALPASNSNVEHTVSHGAEGISRTDINAAIELKRELYAKAAASGNKEDWNAVRAQSALIGQYLGRRPRGRGRFRGRGAGRGGRFRGFTRDEPCMDEKPMEFFCNNCERAFITQADLTCHFEEHVSCAFCRYSAIPQLVKLHTKLQHDTGQASRESPEDIAAYIAERKKRFPTLSRKLEQEQQQCAKRERGEVLTSDNPLGRSPYYIEKNRQSRPLPNNINAFDKNRRATAASFKSNNNVTVNSFIHGESPCPSTSRGPLRSDTTTSNNGAGNTTMHSVAQGRISKSARRSRRRRANNMAQKTNIPEKVSLSDDEDDDPISKVVPRFRGKPRPKVEQITVKCEDMEEENGPLENAGPSISDDSDVEMQAATAGTSGNLNLCGALGSLVAAYDSDDQHNDDVQNEDVKPDVVSVNKPVSVEIPQASMSTATLDVHHKDESQQHKRDDKLKLQQDSRRCPPPRPRAIPRMNRRRLTLLEKLLANDIRKERNTLLQCVRYIVRNNFFDKEKPLEATDSTAPVDASVVGDTKVEVKLEAEKGKGLAEGVSLKPVCFEENDGPVQFTVKVEPSFETESGRSDNTLSQCDHSVEIRLEENHVDSETSVGTADCGVKYLDEQCYAGRHLEKENIFKAEKCSESTEIEGKDSSSCDNYTERLDENSNQVRLPIEGASVFKVKVEGHC